MNDFFFLNIKIVCNYFYSLELVNQSSPSASASCWTATGAMGFLFHQNLCHFSSEFYNT